MISDSLLVTGEPAPTTALGDGGVALRYPLWPLLRA